MVPPRPQRTSLLCGCLVRVCSEGGRRGGLMGEDMTGKGATFTDACESPCMVKVEWSSL